MTKIFEALEQLELERSGAKARLGQTVEADGAPDRLPAELTETLVALYRSIVALVPDSSGRIVQFVEVGQGTGCSNLIRAFSDVVATVLKKSVLLLDSNPQRPLDFNFRNSRARINWLEGVRGVAPSEATGQAVKGALFVSRLFENAGPISVGSDSRQTEEFMQGLKSTIDLTLIDSWSQTNLARPALFSTHVDGIVLVVEAGKTRWQIVEQMKREITAQGGNILGVVLNNRTYPIPQSVYRRL